MKNVGVLGYLMAGLCVLGILLPGLGGWLAPASTSRLAAAGCLLFLGAVGVACYLLNQLQAVARELEEKRRSS